MDNNTSQVTKCNSSSIISSVTAEKLLVKYRQSAVLWKAVLAKYLRYISDPSRREAILKTVQYTLWLFSRVYAQVPIGGSNSSDRKAKANVIESLAALSGELSWARYILRFFGLPAALEGIESGSWASSSSKGLGKALAWTMVFYYPLEHIAYLYWKAPKMHWISTGSNSSSRSSISYATKWNPFGQRMAQRRLTSSTAGNATCPATNSGGDLVRPSMTSSQIAGKASAWSCRFWLAFLVLDIARSAIELQKVQKKKKQNDDDNNKDKRSNLNGDAQDSTDAVDPSQSSMVRTERLQIARNALYILPALHWSLPNWDTKPWLPNDVVNGLCWVEAVVGMYQGIRNFQEG